MLPTYIIMINQSYQSLPNKLSSSKGNTDKFYDKLYAFAARGFWRQILIWSLVSSYISDGSIKQKYNILY